MPSKADRPETMHQGHLSPEARERRRVKNARNHGRRGKAFHEPGATKRVTSRLFMNRGSRRQA